MSTYVCVDRFACACVVLRETRHNAAELCLHSSAYMCHNCRGATADMLKCAHTHTCSMALLLIDVLCAHKTCVHCMNRSAWLTFKGCLRIRMHIPQKGWDHPTPLPHRVCTFPQWLCGAWMMAWCAVVKYHGPRPTPGPNKVWVANHTSMIDYTILCSHSPFAVIMQVRLALCPFASGCSLCLQPAVPRPCKRAPGMHCSNIDPLEKEPCSCPPIKRKRDAGRVPS